MVKKKRVAVRKRMEKSLWFRKYGGKSDWGFVPINWRGWVALILLIVVNVFAANYFDVMNVGFREVSKFLIVFLFSFVVFVLIAKKKTVN